MEDLCAVKYRMSTVNRDLVLTIKSLKRKVAVQFVH